MSDPLKTIYSAAALKEERFPRNSRYYGSETKTLETPAGREIAYLARRFCPDPERFTLLLEHTVTRGDRLDNMTAKYTGDPEMFWLLADANGVLSPAELTRTVGQRIRITLPEGISESK